MGVALREQGHAICVTLGPRLLCGRGSVGRRDWRGEEEGPVARMADAWGLVGSGSRQGLAGLARPVEAGWAVLLPPSFSFSFSVISFALIQI